MTEKWAGPNGPGKIQASSSIGRAAVSKTAGWGFDSLLACQMRSILNFMKNKVSSSATNYIKWLLGIGLALFSALIIIMSISQDGSLVVDARLIGVGIGGLAVWKKMPFTLVVLIAMLSTAVIRLVV